MTFPPATVYRVSARFVQPVSADWRERLAARLGARPRRLGRWAELGLFGALECLHPHNTLPTNTALLLSSRHGPSPAMQEAMAQVRDGLPLPLTFLQIQPSQLLAALSAQLHWRGDARFLTHPKPLVVLSAALALAQDHAHGVLVGWVDEITGESSHWLRLEPLRDATDAPTQAWLPATDVASLDVQTLVCNLDWLRLGSSGLAVIIKG